MREGGDGVARRRTAWQERFPDEVTCVRCLRVRPLEEVDRLLWCEECREAARDRARRWGWGAGAVVALLLALWIWLWVRPSDLVIGGWVATVVAALWGGARVAREVFFGAMRFTNRPAAEASPPKLPPRAPDDDRRA